MNTLNPEEKRLILGVARRSIFFHERVERCRQKLQAGQTVLIGLSGGSGAGKSWWAKQFISAIQSDYPISLLPQDNYYRDFAADFPHISVADFYHQINLDDPRHMNFSALVRDLTTLKTASPGQRFDYQSLFFGNPNEKPSTIPGGYSMVTAPIILTEGIFAQWHPDLRTLYDLSIFIDLEESVRYQRWVERNRQENRGTTDNMWATTVAALQEEIRPTAGTVDLTIENSGDLVLFQQTAGWLAQQLSHRSN